MNTKLFFIYLFIMAGSTYLIRAIPFIAVKKKINNPYIKSFLSYIPYAVLTAMTIPACLYSTDYMLSAVIGIAVAVFFAVRNKGLTIVAAAACCAVFISEYIIRLFH